MFNDNVRSGTSAQITNHIGLDHLPTLQRPRPACQTHRMRRPRIKTANLVTSTLRSIFSILLFFINDGYPNPTNTKAYPASLVLAQSYCRRHERKLWFDDQTESDVCPLQAGFQKIKTVICFNGSHAALSVKLSILKQTSSQCFPSS